MEEGPGDLGATMRAWRDRLTPKEAGLPQGRSRRATGLRREELAELAGVSVDYVVRLEQGRARTPSAQVVGAVARALRLSDEERDHLYRLARLAPPSRAEVSDHIPLGLHRVLTRLPDTAAAVFAADWQLIWWNRYWAALLGDPGEAQPDRRNFARDTFPIDDSEPALFHWPVRSADHTKVEQAVVADLRRALGRFPESRRVRDTVTALREGNDRFGELWKSGIVGEHSEDRKVIDHPSVGPLVVDCDTVSDGDEGRKIVLLTAVPGSTDETNLRLGLLARGVESAHQQTVH